MARDADKDREPGPEPLPRPRPPTTSGPRPAPSPLPPRPIPTSTTPTPAPPTGGRPTPPKIRRPQTSQTLRANALKAYNSTGGVTGALGWPVEPILLSGRMAYWSFSSGYLVADEAGVKDIVVDQELEISYLGFTCLAESDWDQSSSSDEPYFVVSFAGPGATVSRVFSYTKVDKGESVKAPSIFVSRVPVTTGVLHALGMESDFGSQEQARRKVEQEMKNLTAAAAQAASTYDMAANSGANAKDLNMYSDIAGAVLGGPMGALIARGVVAGLDLADDYVGQDGVTLFSKENGYADPPFKGQFLEEHWTHKLFIDGGDEGKYDVYFRVLIVRQPRSWAGGDTPPGFGGEAGTGIIGRPGTDALRTQ